MNEKEAIKITAALLFLQKKYDKSVIIRTPRDQITIIFQKMRKILCEICPNRKNSKKHIIVYFEAHRGGKEPFVRFIRSIGLVKHIVQYAPG